MPEVSVDEAAEAGALAAEAAPEAGPAADGVAAGAGGLRAEAPPNGERSITTNGDSAGTGAGPAPPPAVGPAGQDRLAHVASYVRRGQPTDAPPAGLGDAEAAADEEAGPQGARSGVSHLGRGRSYGTGLMRLGTLGRWRADSARRPPGQVRGAGRRGRDCRG